jgi:hypothetical protein
VLKVRPEPPGARGSKLRHTGSLRKYYEIKGFSNDKASTNSEGGPEMFGVRKFMSGFQLLSIISLVVLALIIPRPSMALSGRKDKGTSDDYFWSCFHLLHDSFECNFLATVYDPIAIGVTDLTMTIAYDPTKYIFDAAGSGPLGAFSVGGDAPPPTPGIGVEPLQLLPATGYEPGDPLPGSTLTYTEAPGSVTVHYTLASPVTVDSEVNFLRLQFDLVTPMIIDFAESRAIYYPSSPGLDFTQTAFSCKTEDGTNQCGSDNPAVGTTFHLVGVPEPATWAMLVSGFGLVGAALRSRGRRARRESASWA